MKLKLIILLFVIGLLSCKEKKQAESKIDDHSQMDHAMDENELHLSAQQIQLGNISVD